MAKMMKFRKTRTGDDLRVFTCAVLTVTGMFNAKRGPGKAISKALFRGFFGSASILKNHGDNGFLAIEGRGSDATVKLTAEGAKFFAERFEALNKWQAEDGKTFYRSEDSKGKTWTVEQEVKAITKWIASGKFEDLPQSWRDHYKASETMVNPASDAK